jgi:hypothetical protein
LLWVIEDSTNKIYGLNPKENSSITIQNAENIDWEELLRIKKEIYI